MPKDPMWWLEFVGKIIGTAIVVLGFLRRSLDNMIAKKVEEQVSKQFDEMTKKITSANTLAIEGLRKELKEHGEATEQTRQAQIDHVTSRIDELFTSFMQMWGRK